MTLPALQGAGAPVGLASAGFGWLWLARFLGFRLDFGLILALAWLWLGFGWIWLLAFIYYDFAWIWLDLAWILVHYTLNSSHKSLGSPRRS